MRHFRIAPSRDVNFANLRFRFFDDFPSRINDLGASYAWIEQRNAHTSIKELAINVVADAFPLAHGF